MIKDFEEFDRHFGAKEQPKKPIDIHGIIVGAMVGFLVGLFILSLL